MGRIVCELRDRSLSTGRGATTWESRGSETFCAGLVQHFLLQNIISLESEEPRPISVSFHYISGTSCAYTLSCI